MYYVLANLRAVEIPPRSGTPGMGFGLSHEYNATAKATTILTPIIYDICGINIIADFGIRRRSSEVI